MVRFSALNDCSMFNFALAEISDNLLLPAANGETACLRVSRGHNILLMIRADTSPLRFCETLVVQPVSVSFSASFHAEHESGR
jgi:hypothetical protein